MQCVNLVRRNTNQIELTKCTLTAFASMSLEFLLLLAPMLAGKERHILQLGAKEEHEEVL